MYLCWSDAGDGSGPWQYAREDDPLRKALLGEGKALWELFRRPLIHGARPRRRAPAASAQFSGAHSGGLCRFEQRAARGVGDVKGGCTGGRRSAGSRRRQRQRQRLSWSDTQGQNEGKLQTAGREGGYIEKSVSSRAFSSAQRQAVRSRGQGCMACTVLSVAEELALACGRCSSRLASASWCCELRAARLRRLRSAVAARMQARGQRMCGHCCYCCCCCCYGLRRRRLAAHSLPPVE
jgi:hypothetical protein